MPTFELFNQFSEFVDVLQGGEDWQNQPFFSKYFSMDSSNSDEEKPFPKFILYSAHQETISPLGFAFGWEPVQKLWPASAFFLEFWSPKDQPDELYVRVIYKLEPGF